MPDYPYTPPAADLTPVDLPTADPATPPPLPIPADITVALVDMEKRLVARMERQGAANRAYVDAIAGGIRENVAERAGSVWDAVNAQTARTKALQDALEGGLDTMEKLNAQDRRLNEQAARVAERQDLMKELAGTFLEHMEIQGGINEIARLRIEGLARVLEVVNVTQDRILDHIETLSDDLGNVEENQDVLVAWLAEVEAKAQGARSRRLAEEVVSLMTGEILFR